MADLAASYVTSGFVHGVLNTDNMNISGESFDYGPWRWLPQLGSGVHCRLFRPQRALLLRPAGRGDPLELRAAGDCAAHADGDRAAGLRAGPFRRALSAGLAAPLPVAAWRQPSRARRPILRWSMPPCSICRPAALRLTSSSSAIAAGGTRQTESLVPDLRAIHLLRATMTASGAEKPPPHWSSTRSSGSGLTSTSETTGAPSRPSLLTSAGSARRWASRRIRLAFTTPWKQFGNLPYAIRLSFMAAFSLW